MSKINKVFSAPMAGVSDKPFRMMLRRFSDAPVFTEMVGVETLIHRHPKTLKMMRIQDEKNLIVQLVGANPDSFEIAGKMAEDAGAIGIDINMGCPVKKLIQNHSGAELMRFPDLAARLVESVKKNVSVPVSVKTRLGWSDKSEIGSFVKILEQAGADQIEIHARTKEMGFRGTADWEAIGSLVQTNIPIIVNGDIKNYVTAEEALEKSHANGIMVGRALLGHPWRLAEIATGRKPNYNICDIVLTHLELMLSHYGRAGLFAARKHLAWYATGKKNVAAWREKMYLEEDESKLKQMIIDFFEDRT